VKPVECGGGRSFVGLGEREVPMRSLVVTEVILPRKKGTAFIVPTTCSCSWTDFWGLILGIWLSSAVQWNGKEPGVIGRERKT
jgi:hypothetical protein